jgi:hypothetical protein
MERTLRNKKTNLHLVAGLCALSTCLSWAINSAEAQETATQLASRQPVQQQAPVQERTASVASSESRPAEKSARTRGPYYVDFRARTAASYGHAFIWFGKTSERKVEVAGLHPAGDALPYVLGHLMFVPSETGASYGDLDVQYLTASYRVYLSERDAKKVFAYIKYLQAHSPVWNAQTSNCTAFIGSIAAFMGMKVPFHLKRPEEYVNSLKQMNGGRQTVQLAPEQQQQQLSAGQ